MKSNPKTIFHLSTESSIITNKGNQNKISVNYILFNIFLITIFYLIAQTLIFF